MYRYADFERVIFLPPGYTAGALPRPRRGWPGLGDQSRMPLPLPVTIPCSTAQRRASTAQACVLFPSVKQSKLPLLSGLPAYRQSIAASCSRVMGSSGPNCSCHSLSQCLSRWPKPQLERTITREQHPQSDCPPPWACPLYCKEFGPTERGLRHQQCQICCCHSRSSSYSWSHTSQHRNIKHLRPYWNMDFATYLEYLQKMIRQWSHRRPNYHCRRNCCLQKKTRCLQKNRYRKILPRKNCHPQSRHQRKSHR